MTKLYSPRGWLGYFVGCESKAMYYIYSPEKHKVYRIGAPRIEDGEGLDNSHDVPCLEDRIPTVHQEVPDELDSRTDQGTDDETATGPNNGDDNLLSCANRAVPALELPEVEEEYIQTLQANDDADVDDESESDATEHEVLSRYFARSRYTNMAKRKAIYNRAVIPKKSRLATYNTNDTIIDASLSAISDNDTDSQYYSDDGKIS